MGDSGQCSRRAAAHAASALMSVMPDSPHLQTTPGLQLEHCALSSAAVVLGDVGQRKKR